MASIFSCLCSGGFERDRSIRRDWSFPHSPPIDPDLSDVEEDDEYYTYPLKNATNTVALGGSTTKVVYTNDDEGGGDSGIYISDEGIYYESGENNSVNDSVNGIYSTPTGDGGYEYDDGGYDDGDGYASGDAEEEGGGDDDDNSYNGGGGYESA
ncbi:hypothetical protein BC332_19698 [Capsicum chinense]|nr:hypothetical protein BC332_19698 [Capsicum chinense]